MALVADLVLETSNNPGTGTFTLAGSPNGRRTFAQAFGATGQVFYIAHDGLQWEEGVGTVQAGSPDTLSRDIIRGNSLGTLALINFTSAVSVYCDIPAAHAVYSNAGNDAVLAGYRKMSTLIAGVAPDDAPRLDQVGWRFVSEQVSPTPVQEMVFELPDTFTTFRLTFQDIAGSGVSCMYLRFSVDGGATALATNVYNYNNVLSKSGGVFGAAVTANSYLQLTPDTTQGAVFGFYEFSCTGAKQGVGHIGGSLNDGTNFSTQTYGSTSNPATASHVVLGFNNGAVNTGRVRLWGTL